MPASTTSLPAVPMLYTIAHRHAHTHQTTHAYTAYIHTHTDRIFKSIIKIRQIENIWGKGQIFKLLLFHQLLRFKFKAILQLLSFFYIFNLWFKKKKLTSALFGTCCYKSSVEFSYKRGEMRKRGKARRVAITVFALHQCICERTRGYECMRACREWMNNHFDS